MKSGRKKIPKKYLLGGFVFLSLVIGVSIPIIMPNGTDRFAGVEKDAANGGLKFTSDFFNGLNSTKHFATMKVVVEKVEVAKNQDRRSCNSDFTTSNSSGDEKVYDVTLSFRTLFGISTGDFTTKVCKVSEGGTPLLRTSEQ